VIRAAEGRAWARGPVKKRDHDGEVKFGYDSPVEGRGFKPPVPLAKRVGLSGGTGSAAEAQRAVSKVSGLMVRIRLPPSASQ
jgi:hypothetical protein